MTYSEMKKGFNEAKEAMRIADVMASDMAEILVDRLKHVRPSTLAKLKRELKGFNARERRWG